MKHLISNCAGKIELCQGCSETVKQGPNQNWFITMGHAGFNTYTNNAIGYATKEKAEQVSAFYLRLKGE